MRPPPTTTSDTRAPDESRRHEHPVVEHPVVDVAVVSGPDCSAPVPLGVGRYVLGRIPAAKLRIDDARIGLHHAIVEVSRSKSGGTSTVAVSVTQLSGQAPIRVWGEPVVGTQSVDLPARLSIGMNDVDIRRRGADVIADVIGDDPPPSKSATIALPGPRPERVGVSAAGLLGAAAAASGALIAAVLERPRLAVAALLVALAITVAWVVDGILTWRANRRGDCAADAERASFIERLVAERTTARLRHLDEHRRLEQLIKAADQARDPLLVGSTRAVLWGCGLRRDTEAGNDIFRPVVGVGTRTWSPELEGRIAPDTATDIDRAAVISDVPIPVELRCGETVAVAGDRTETDALVRSMITQLAILHAPTHWQLVIVSVDRARWKWAAVLPHARSVIGSSLIIDPTTPALLVAAMSFVECPASRSTLLVIDQPSRLDPPCDALRGFIERSEPATLTLVARDESVPDGCSAVIDVGSTGVTSISGQDGLDVSCGASAVSMCGLSGRRATAIARSLATLADTADADRGHPLEESPSSHRGPLPNRTASSSAL